MGRPVHEIEDSTALNSPRVDINARIGWLLRTWRLYAGVDLRTLADRSAETAPVSYATLSRWEATGARRSTMIDTYERALGLDHGTLRGPIDTLCRTFVYSPDDLAPLPVEPTVAEFDQIGAAVHDDPSAADWLRFVEVHTDGVFGLPPRDLAPLVHRLASEMNRAVGNAYRVRYDALARLRCSRYGDVVVEAILDQVRQPGVQRAADLMSAACEQGSPDLLLWCARFLVGDSAIVSRAAAAGIDNICAVGGVGAADWDRVVPHLVDAVEALADRPACRDALAAALAASPRRVRTEVRARCGEATPTPGRAPDWTPRRRNQQFSRAQVQADDLVATVGPSAGSSLLARLIFEIGFDVRAVHAVTSSFLLGASPYQTHVTRQVVGWGAAREGRDVELHADHALGCLMPDTSVTDPIGVTGSVERVRFALRVEAFAGRRPELSDQRLWDLASDPATTSATLFALGMAGDPMLARLVADHPDPGIRTAAAWWVQAGPRVAR